MITNPSAGKFEAPPAPVDPMERPPLYKRPWFIALMLAGYAAQFWVKTHRGRGWYGLAGVCLAIGIGVVQRLVNRAARESRPGGDSPYSPPANITR